MRLRHRLALLLAGLPLLTGAQAPGGIAFGASYYDEYMPGDRLEEDMRLMSAAGFTVIRIGESTWGTMEPSDGVFDFGHIDRVLSAAERHGIKVIVGTPTYAVPTWLYRAHPEVLAETVAGPNRYGARQNMDWTNPVFRRYAERAIRRLVEHVRTSPAVIGYQLDNETKEYGHVGANRVAGYRAYVRARFGTLDRLNEALGLNFWSNRVNDWADLPSPAGTVNPSVTVVYQDYRRQLVTDYLAWQARLVRSLAAPGQFITHNFDMNNVWGAADVDQWAVGRVIDRAGVDIYFGAQDDLSGSQIALGGDMARSVKQGRNYFVLETQARGMTNLAGYPGQLRQAAFSHLASGADMLLYWHWGSTLNGAETYFRGVLPHDLQPDEVYDEVRSIGTDLRRLGPALTGLTKRNQVAVYVSHRSIDAFNAFSFGWGTTQKWDEIWRPFYEQLYRLNTEVDFVDPSTPAAQLGRYRLIVVPALYAAADDELRRLNDYARDGGHLLLSFKSGFADEHARVRPVTQPALLTEAVGATYNDFVLPRDVRLAAPGLRLAPEDRAARWWMELLEPRGAEVLARYDHPVWGRYAAVIRHAFGRGEVTYLGTMPSDAALAALLDDAVTRARVDRPAARFPLIERGGVNARGDRLHYLFNYSASARDFPYRGGPGRELLSGRRVSGGAVPLPAWGTAIVEENGATTPEGED